MEPQEECDLCKTKTKRKKIRPIRPKIDWMILPNALAYLTAWYGLFVGKFPVQILCVAVGIGVIFSAGFYRIKIDDVKPEDYLPTNSPSIRERVTTLLFDVDEPERPSKFPNILYNRPANIGRKTTSKRPSKMTTTTSVEELRHKRALPGSGDGFVSTGSFSQSCRQNTLLLIAKQNVSGNKPYNLFNKTVFSDIERLERLIFDIRIPMRKANGKMVEFRYEPSNRDDVDDGLCTRQQTGECGGFSLRILRHFFQADYDPTTMTDDPFDIIFSDLPGIGLTFPQFFSNDFTKYFARVETNENGFVKSIGAIREIYCLNEFYFEIFKAENKVWLPWEAAFDRLLRSANFTSQYFEISWMAEYQRGGEQMSLITDMVPKIGVTFFALMLWCCVGGLMTDSARSKPWAGVLGVFATFFACTAGFGICLWNEPHFNPILMAVPLLVLAIGLDDMFIALEAWSRTDATLPVEERMMTAMHIGGTTIFITFCINLIDFVVGNYTPFPLINKLSIYAISAMVFDFIFQLTIFAPSLVIFGYLEQNKRHSCCCCLKTKNRRHALMNRGTLSLICCSRTNSSEFRKKTAAVNFLTNFLTRLPVRVISVIIFFAYVAVCGWSISDLEIGLKPERVYRQSSNMYTFWQKNRQYFSEYADEIKVVVNNELNYTQPKTRQRLLDFIDKIHSSGYFWPKETKCWLVDFENWVTEKNLSFSSGADLISQLERFPGGFFDSADPKTLRSYRNHMADVRVDHNETAILKVRFRIRARDLSSPARQIGMMTSLRQIIDSYRPGIEMYAYGDNFVLYDNYLTAVPTTLYYCGMTLGTTFVVAIFLIPHPACLLWVAIFVTSVLAGIIGMMRFWDMDLDSITLINLLIAISFCSDLIAHPIHVFLVSRVPDAASMPAPAVRLVKTRALIEEVALAALPACVGTTLSVIAMSTSDAYIFSTFFRMMFLSVLLSIVHALIFVPAFMSFFGPSNAGITREGEQQTDQTSSHISGDKISPLGSPIKTSPLPTDLRKRRTESISCEPMPHVSRPPNVVGNNNYSEEDVKSFTAFIPAEAMKLQVAEPRVLIPTNTSIRTPITNQSSGTWPIYARSLTPIIVHHDISCKGCDMCARF